MLDTFIISNHYQALLWDSYVFEPTGHQEWNEVGCHIFLISLFLCSCLLLRIPRSLQTTPLASSKTEGSEYRCSLKVGILRPRKSELFSEK